MTLSIRLVAYAPNGDRLGVLPTPQGSQAAFVLGDVGAFSVDYPSAGPRSPFLAGPCEVAVELSYDDGQTWSEPNDARFLRLRRKGDTLDRPQVVTYEGPSLAWVFSKARVLPEGKLNADGKRAFLSATAGTILRTLGQEAQARGALAGIDLSTFGTATDSAGQPWDKIITIYYEPGLDYLSILLNLQQQGIIDFTMAKRSLRLFNADTVMAGPSDASLVRGRDLSEAPYQGTLEGLASFAYLLGDEGAAFSRTNPEALAPWGRWETFITQGGVSDPGTMTVLTDAALTLASDERVENTYGLAFSDPSPLPFRDYALGQDVLVRDGDALPQSLRVRQVTLTTDEKGAVSGNVVLNDRFLEAEVRQSRRVTGITNGSTADGGSGARPAPDFPDPGADSTIPNTPAGIVLSSTAYLDGQGRPYATITVNWGDVTENTDGTACTDLAGYEVLVRLMGDDTWTIYQTDTGTGWTRGGYEPNTTYQVSLRAFDQSFNRSALSDPAQIITEQDATAPAEPSVPLVTVYLGQLLITWDGKTSTGGTMATDWAGTEVHVSTAPGFNPTQATLVDAITGRTGGSTVATGLDYDTPYYVRFVAVDRQGHASPPSVAASGTPVRLNSPDVMTGAITTIKIADAAVTNAKIDTITADKITAGVISAAITISGKIATALTGQRTELNAAGLTSYDASGNVIFDTSGGSLTMTGSLKTNVSGPRVELFGNAQGGTIWLRSGISNETHPGSIYTNFTGTGASADALLYIQAPQKDGLPTCTIRMASRDADTGADFTLFGYNGSVYWNSDAGYGTHYYYSTGGSILDAWLTVARYGADGAQFRTTGRTAPSMTLNNSAGEATINNTTTYIAVGADEFVVGGRFTHVATGSNHKLNFTNEFGTTRFGGNTDANSAYVESDVAYARTYGSAANMVITSAGVIGRSTSSARYKIGIEDAVVPLDAVKALRPITFYDKANAERYNALVEEALGLGTYGDPDVKRDVEYPRQHVGLLAEDVAAVGLEWLLDRNDSGEPEAVYYERLPVLLLAWLSDLEGRMGRLESTSTHH